LLRVGPERTPIAVTGAYLTAFAERVVALLGDWRQWQPDALGPTRAALLTQLHGAVDFRSKLGRSSYSLRPDGDRQRWAKQGVSLAAFRGTS
jgi:hypothetical protein